VQRRSRQQAGAPKGKGARTGSSPSPSATRADNTPPSVTLGQIRFHLELQVERDPIEGHVSDERGQTIFFTGWLELITVLEKALADAADRRPKENESPP
jgi:hypothetical protein